MVANLFTAKQHWKLYFKRVTRVAKKCNTLEKGKMFHMTENVLDVYCLFI